jgi:hypothetical protein
LILEDLPKKIRITKQTEEEMLDNREDDGRTDFEADSGHGKGTTMALLWATERNPLSP